MIWLIGAGQLAENYHTILRDLGRSVQVIGRGKEKAEAFATKTGAQVFSGGLDAFLATNPDLPEASIVCVDVNQLAPCALSLINFGAKKILLEKPAGLNAAEIRAVAEKAEEKSAKVTVAYNRRYYQSVEAARKIIARDNGVISFSFEFTEWAHVLINAGISPLVLENWFLANSSHVIDLAFHLGGIPKSMQSRIAGQGVLPWHPAASRFVGAGESSQGALFSYQANWESPGRWGIELMTRHHRLFFRPMEELHVQVHGSVKTEKIELEEIDKSYKPGLYRQTEAFLNNQMEHGCSISEQVNKQAIYQLILHGGNL